MPALSLARTTGLLSFLALLALHVPTTAVAAGLSTPTKIVQGFVNRQLQSSADGKRLAYVMSGSVIVSDLSSGSPHTVFRRTAGPPATTSVGLSADGRRVMYTSVTSKRATLHVVDIATRRQIKDYPGYVVSCEAICVSDDLHYATVVPYKRSAAAPRPGILDLKTGRFTAVTPPVAGYKASGAWALSGNGDWALTVDISLNRGDRWYLLSRKTGRARFLGLGDQAAPALSADGSIAALPIRTTDSNLNSTIYQRLSGARSVLPGFEDLTLSADGNTSAVACAGGLYLFHTDSGSYATLLEGLPSKNGFNYVGRAVLSPDGKFLFYVLDIPSETYGSVLSETLYRVATTEATPLPEPPPACLGLG